MSEVRLVVRDAQQSLSGTIHGSVVDRLVAALAAEPETIAELNQAARRFAKFSGEAIWGRFYPGDNDEHYDAGVAVIDLAARLVVIDSTYSSPGREGCVDYHDGHCSTNIGIHYLLSDDWAFHYDADSWRGLAKNRRAQRAANPPLDARAVLYGPALLEHVARGCYTAFIAASDAPQEDQAHDLIKQIHVDWLMTPRNDLRGKTPREVMMAKQDFINRDLHYRNLQWSEMGRCPPLLDRHSNAYRFAGFGRHEMVVYYDLVRRLLEWSSTAALEQRESTRANCLASGEYLRAEMPRLAQVRDAWLDEPEPEYSGHTPSLVIENERVRKPEVASKREFHDWDCPCCQAMADLPGLMFWGLDGSHLDYDEFAFDLSHATLEEWEEDNRRSEEFHRKFTAQQAERDRLGVKYPGSGYADPHYVWKRSFVAQDKAADPLPLRLFAIGTFLAELLVDLQEAGVEQPLIDALRRDYGELREALRSDDELLSTALATPVLSQLRDTLSQAAAPHEQLRPKCDDLAHRLDRFLEPPSESPEDEEWWEDDDIPF